MLVEDKGMGMARYTVALWGTMSRWRGRKWKAGKVRFRLLARYMLGNYKHSFFGSGLCLVFPSKGAWKEAGGWLLFCDTEKTKSMNRGSNLVGEM